MASKVLEGRSTKQELRDLFAKYGNMSDKMVECLETYSKMNARELVKNAKAMFENLLNPAEYLDKKGDPCSKEQAKYVWVSSGVEDAMKGNPLYVAFVKNDENGKKIYGHDYYCYYVGTRSILERNLASYLSDAEEVGKESTKLCAEIYDMLLVKGDWAKLPGYYLLREMLELTESKIRNDEEQGYADRNCTYNENRTKIAYNPGLISIYGNDIIIVADVDENGVLSNRRISQSKTQLKQEGFVTTDVQPVMFYQSRKDLIFSATADDFDLDNFGRLRHIIEQRRDRFPEDAKNLPDDELFNKIRTSLEFDLKMTARNPYWAAPFYNVKQDEIQYFLPLFTKSLSDEPTLAMVVGKGEHYYEVRTVLPLKLAYANAVCVASPPSSWLEKTAVKE